jgi:23S rRNA (guanosine2251-2'-O)-methyltransferase
MTVALYNIRSAWNVGSIFRSCDALGMDIILVGYTPKPVGNTLPLIKKTSIGAEKTVSWESFDHHQEVFEKYNKSTHLAIEITKDSKDIFEYLNGLKKDENNFENTIIWFGNEIHGVPEEVCNLCKHSLHLPMVGTKESLNVANTVTSTGYLFAFCDSMKNHQ